jgi:hypothetical protein
MDRDQRLNQDSRWVRFNSRLGDNLRMYWPHGLATILFVIAVWRYLTIGQWEAQLIAICAAAFGFVCVVASHEVADWTGRYGWTHESFWTYPPTYVRFVGFVFLGGALFFGFG